MFKDQYKAGYEAAKADLRLDRMEADIAALTRQVQTLQQAVLRLLGEDHLALPAPGGE